MSSEKPPRYRLEGERACIELRLKTLQQLFDGRDPAPFRERDLDEDAVEYIVGAAEEIAPKVGLKLVVWISESPEQQQLESTTVVEAIRGHFGYEIDRLRRRIREHVRQGQMALLVGLAVLVVFLTLAELTLMVPTGHVRQILREGLVITGWVAMWRPLELLLYDWWPLVRKRRLFTRILASDIAIVRGHPADERPRSAAGATAQEGRSR
jgi:hypothetical protein